MTVSLYTEPPDLRSASALIMRSGCTVEHVVRSVCVCERERERAHAHVVCKNYAFLHYLYILFPESILICLCILFM